jgi:arylsulfatase A-like enzyme
MQHRLPLLTLNEIAALDALRLKQLQSLAAVDEAIDRILTYLHNTQMLNDTVVILISDNSIFLGEHRLQEKGLFYEEAIHVPMAIRYPRLITGSQIRRHLVANIDIAPTVYDLAGISPPAKLDGRSLVPLMSRPKVRWRKYLLIEGWPDTFAGTETCSPPYTAIHTGRSIYAESHPNHRDQGPCSFQRPDKMELYDLQNDRYQSRNVVYDPGYDALRKKLKDTLDKQGFAPLN